MGNDKPLSSETVEMGGQQYEKVVYKDKNLYFDQNGSLVITEVTNPSYQGDALAKALEAYKKAAELDAAGKKTKAITDALNTIAQNYNQDAFNAYYLGNPSKASTLFEKSAAALAQAPLSKLDTASIYYAGVTAMEAQEFEKAKAHFTNALKNNYFSDGGVYANLYECAINQKDTVTARSYLEEGFQKFPENPQVLTNLINLYIAANEDPNKLIDLLGKAKAELPNNPSLYYVEGDIYGRMKDYDNAVKAYRKASEVDPNYEMGHYGEGVMWFNRALAIQEEAAALPYSEYKKYDQLQEELKVALKNAIEPFEKCFAVTKNDAVKTNVADYLKRLYFVFRNESADYQAAYEKYNNFLENAK
ncbi:MAG: tetratricopeptide repeat protein [Bacteroidales bacterium]|nr:tetratricopeptide repeat protein [Bacteroidales bacterium]